MGGYDVFRYDFTHPEKGVVNMGYPINTTDNNLFYLPAGDGSTAYYSFLGPDSYGGRDIYLVNAGEEKEEAGAVAAAVDTAAVAEEEAGAVAAAVDTTVVEKEEAGAVAAAVDTTAVAEEEAGAVTVDTTAVAEEETAAVAVAPVDTAAVGEQNIQKDERVAETKGATG